MRKLKTVEAWVPQEPTADLPPVCRPINPGQVFLRSFLFLLASVLGFQVRPVAAQTFGCNPPMANDIVCENSKSGNPPSDWQISGAGDLTIQGFATDISVNQGGTISFKIDTDAVAYTIDIYRIGYYGGDGARKVASISPSVHLPQNQPACLSDSTTKLLDCGNWAVSASWSVPTNATSGVYIAHLVRTDTGGDSHIVFVVRNDTSHSDILYQTSDTSWQAYNTYGPGGFSLYGDQNAFDLPNRAFKVSYNRPFTTRSFEQEAATWVFGAEFSMIQWLEQNGYDVTYFTGVDAARNGSLIKNHKVYTSNGHDEYWSGAQRTNVQAARDAGVNLAFFSGNEVFWKVRFENSIDGTNTANRTLVCYKETLGSGGSGPSARLDPDDPPTWTGTWRDPSFSPPDDGGNPENSLTGTLFEVNGTGSDNNGTLAIQVPAADGKMRFWRNTAAAALSSGQTYNLPAQTLGYESDVDADNGSRPAGAFPLSTTTETLTSDYLLDYGANYGPGTAVHHMMMYRAASGALVFSTGSIDWAWGLNSNHDDPFGSPQSPDLAMQQSAVNLFADMHVQPATLQAGLLPATASTDTTPPSSTITAPVSGSTITTGSVVTISGSATDLGGGVVAGVELSLDGGNTWHPASGREHWTYTWSPSTLGSTTIKSRAVDDSGNLETPSAGVSVTVAPPDCPCMDWSSTIPSEVDSGDGKSVNLGVKFRTDFNGFITGIRFYKSTANIGTHIGNLWSSAGTLLATATFTNETASGWQQVDFGTPVAITANTVYVASYFAPAGHYSATEGFFANSGIDDPPLHLLQNGANGPNGLYVYGTGNAFPTSTFNSTNYWVDVVFMPSQTMPGAPPALLANPSSLQFVADIGNPAPPAQSISLFNEGTGTVNWTASKNSSWLVLSASSGTLPYTLNASVNPAGLASGTYTDTITITASGNIPTTTINVSLNVTNVLLAANFATEGLEGWVPGLGSRSSWSVVSVVNQAAAQYSGAGVSELYAGNAAWTNYTLSVPIKLSSLSNYPGGIRGRVNPSTGASYMLWLYPASGQIILYRAPGWDISQGLVQLATGSASFDTVQFHNVALTFNGSQIQATYDGNMVLSATDSAYANGLVALEGDNQVITFGNVFVNGSEANSGLLGVGASSLTYSATLNGPNPAPQTVQLSSTGGSLAWTAVSNAPWLSASPAGGVTPATLTISVNSSSLLGGTYTGAITVSSLGSVTVSYLINVNLTVVVPPPVISLSPGGMSFSGTAGQASPPVQPLSILNGGAGSFSWTASTDSAWLSVSLASGTTPATTNVAVNTSGLGAGSYTGHVTITANGVSNSPQSITVVLELTTEDLSENFSDLGTGWIISPMGNASSWSVSNGVYSYNGSGLSQSCTGNGNWTDYSYDAHIKLSTLANWPGGVRARVNPVTGAGYAVWLYPGSNLAVLYRVGVWSINDSSLTELAQASLSFDTTATHDLNVTFRGSQISISWDGRLLLQAADSTYGSGFVCLDADNQPISYSNISVSAVQTPAALAAPSPTSLIFAAAPGVTPPSQSVNISAGGASTAWAVRSNVSWLSATSSTTMTPGVITASPNPAGLAEGTYNGTLSVYAPGATNSPITITVTLAVKTAVLSVTPASLTFFGAPTQNPTPQNVQVANAGTGSLSWAARATSQWLGLSPASGSAPATIIAAPSTTALANGSYQDTITVSSSDVAGPATVPVSLQVGTLLFSDNFSSGSGNWMIGPLGEAAGWSLANDIYSYNGSGQTSAWAGSTSWTDYTVAVDFKLASLNDWPGGLRGRLNATTGSGYGVWIYPAQGVLILYRIGQWDINASSTSLGQSAVLKMDSTNFHRVRLCFRGSTIQVYYDEVLVISATDSTYTNGAIALDVSNQPISFTNVNVISLP